MRRKTGQSLTTGWAALRSEPLVRCWGYPDMPFTRSTRGLMALLQLAALAVSLGVGVVVSQCPPGMDMGMDMSTAIDAAPHGPGNCPFGGSMNEEGDMSCPLAIGGIGPCGTGAVASSDPVMSLALAPPARFVEVSRETGHSDGFRAIHLPPPRV